MKIQIGERIAATPELDSVHGRVICHCGARGMGYWATTQVKELSPVIDIMSVADVVEDTQSHTLVIVLARLCEPDGT